MARQSPPLVSILFILRCLFIPCILSPHLVEAFSNPSPTFGNSFLVTSLKPTAVFDRPIISSQTAYARSVSYFGASGIIDDVSMPEDNMSKEYGSNSFASSGILQCLNKNKKALALASAIVSASVLSMPSASNAAPVLAEIGTIANDPGSIASSASSFIEQISETGFYQAFSLVFLSEIGDKTFFIAGLLAMKTSRFISLVGSIGALAAMTVVSCLIGQIFHAVPPGLTQGIPLDDIAAVAAFTFFGLKTLKEAIDLDPAAGNIGMDEEFAEAEETVEGSQTIKEITAWGQIASTFGLVFAAEFGDRSFLATIALSAAQNPFSVAGGAVAAHAIATGIAVVGGGVLAKYISEKVIGYIGGTLFLVFALTTALGIF